MLKILSSRKHLLIAVLSLAGLLFVLRPNTLPARADQPAPTTPKPAFTVAMNWPTDVTASAVGIKGYGVIASNNDTQQRPTASVAKVITALAILEKHPLSDGDDGPWIPITAADQQLYWNYVAKNGTVVLVQPGTPITERDALKAMLLPSANNIADTAAIWAFGSLKNYRDYADAMLQNHKIYNTTIGIDASGLDPSTKSTASDLVRIGELALNNPTIAQIAVMHSAYIPYAGPIPNYNAMVVNHGYTGIKPGESIQAGNTLLFSTDQVINGKTMTVIGATLHSPGYKESDADAQQIVDSVTSTLRPAK